MQRLDDDTTNGLENFGYVVSCQVYGSMKHNYDPNADDLNCFTKSLIMDMPDAPSIHDMLSHGI